MHWFAISSVPMGWLLWPDQQPQLQHQWLQSYEFQFLENLTLMSCSVQNLKLARSSELIRPLTDSQIEANANLLVNTHKIPFI